MTDEHVSFREHFDSMLKDIKDDIAELKEGQQRQEKRLAELVSWRALGAILTLIAALGAFVFSIADRI